MVQRGERLRLAFEARQTIRIGGKQLRQDLQRHVAVQARIARAIDLAHPAGAEHGLNLERSQACARTDCHEVDPDYTALRPPTALTVQCLTSRDLMIALSRVSSGAWSV